MVLGISKRPDREINYGTGNDVSEESIADGKIPLKIRWYNDSYIEIPCASSDASSAAATGRLAIPRRQGCAERQGAASGSSL